MRIAKIETLQADAGWRVFSFLKITTDEGLVGCSEYVDNFGVAGSVTALLPRYAAIVQGMDPRAVGKISASLRGITQLATGGLAHQAIAAIENACLDLKARALGVPVCSLFGGPTRERIRLYWSHCGSFRVRHAEFFEKALGKPPIRTLEDLTALGREAIARGFSAIKTNPLFFDGPAPRMFDGGFALGSKLLDRNIDGTFIAAVTDVLAAFRAGIGKAAGLMIDLNFSQRIEGMRRVAKAVEPYDLTWLEIDLHDPAGLALVRRSSTTPIGSLEAIHGLGAYRPFFERQAVDVAILDPAWNGVLEAYRIAALADAYEVQIAPHNFCGDLATLMSAQLCAAIPNCRILEYEVDDVPWKHDFVTDPPEIVNGELIVPTRSGWGAELNEEAIRAHPVKRR